MKLSGLTIKKRFIFIVSLFVFIAMPGGARELPFKAGEEIRYSISWEMIPAGKAVFKANDFTTVKGEKAWYFTLEAKSNSYVSLFYKIRDKFESYTDKAFTHSLLYTKTQRGSEKKQIKVKFDWEKLLATYSNFGGRRPPVEIKEGTFDPLSSFYKLRTLDLVKKEDLFFPVTDGKKTFIQKGEIIKKETLELSSGTYETYLIIPSAEHFSGVFKKSDNPTIKVWVTADERQIPVRVKIGVFIGSVIFDLKSFSK